LPKSRDTGISSCTKSICSHCLGHQRCLLYGTSRAVAGTYRGCLGWFHLVTPRHRGVPIRRATSAPRPKSLPPLPHARTVMTDWLQRRSNHSLFAGPIGSRTWRNVAGLLDRQANRFTSRRPGRPSRLAKPTHRRSVGSSRLASAAEGLRQTNNARSVPLCQARSRT
jgi:hypothetical protein